MSARSNRPNTFVTRLYQVLTPSRKSKSRSPARRTRLGLERLEDRLTPTQLTVTSAADPATLTAGTLRYEVNQANTDAADGVSDSIVFNTTQMGANSITLAQGQLELKAGGGTTTIEGGGQITVSGNKASRVFQIDSGAQAILNRLTIEQGFGSGTGGGVQNNGTLTLSSSDITGNSVTGSGDNEDNGGGIANYGTLTVSSSTVSDNSVDQSVAGGDVQAGGGIANYATMNVNNSIFSDNTAEEGGAIDNFSGTLTISNSTLSDNSSGFGGAILNYGTLALSTSTLAGNSAAYGGGLYNQSGSALVSNSTITGNVAQQSGNASGGGIYNGGQLTVSDSTISDNSATTSGGGIFSNVNPNALTLEDTIVAANSAAATPDIYGTITTDNGYNLLGTAVNNTTNDPHPGPHDIFSDAPELAALANNGGPTQTMALLSGSPAIGAGVAIAGITTDQRGFGLPGNDPDIGAFQTQTSLVVTTAADPGEISGQLALREAVNLANVYDAAGSSPTISFSSSLNGDTITLNSGQLELTAGTGTTTINGGDQITVSGNNASRVFQVDSGAQAVLSNLTVEAGTVIGENGGGILNNGTLTLSYDTLSGSNADDSTSGFSEIGGSGGGIANFGTLNVSNSTFADNTATSTNGPPFRAGSTGGGIANFGTLTVSDSTFSANNAKSSLDFGANGGAIFSDQSLTVSNSTFSGNSAVAVNDGFLNDGGSGGGICIAGGTASVIDSAISGNTAGYGGGGICVETGSLALEDTIVAANTATSTGPDIDGSIKTDNGYNLLGTAVNNSSTDLTPGPHDIFSDAPGLATLANNGGPTQTMALLSGSPAIGAGVAIAGVTTDQRGVNRPNPPDIGAYQTTVPTLVSITVSAPSMATAGTGFSVTITAKDQFGDGYNCTVTLTCSDGQSVTPNTVTLVNGTATVTVTLYKTDTVTLTAASGSIKGTSGSITVVSASAFSINISSATSTVTAGVGFSVTVTGKDQYGNGYDGNATITCSDGQSVTPSTVTLVNGTVTTTVILDKVDTVTLTAATGLVAGTSGSITVNPAGANHLSFSVQPSDATAGTAIAPAVEVEVLDSFDNLLSSDDTDQVTLSIASGPKKAIFASGSTTKMTVSDGIATFNNLIFDKASGSTDYTLGENATGGLTGPNSIGFKVSAAAASQLTVHSSLNLGAEAPAPSDITLTFGSYDAYSNLASDITGLTVSVSDSLSDDNSSKTVQMTNGSATFSTTLVNGSTTSSDNFTVTFSGKNENHSVVSRSISGTVAPFVPGAGGSPSVSLYAAAVFTGSISVLDAFGDAIVPSQTFSIAATDDAQAEVAIADEESVLREQLTSEGFDLGSGSVITTVNQSSGDAAVTVTPFGETSGASEDLDVTTDGSFQGSPGAVASFALTVPVSSTAGSPTSVTVTALDANGNVVTDYTGTVSLVSGDPQAGPPLSYTFTSADQGSHTFAVDLYTAGSQTLTATDTSDNTITGQSTVEVTPSPVAASFILASPSVTTAGSGAPITVTALDAYGNVATGYTGTISLESSDSQAGQPVSYTFTSADQGSHTFTVNLYTAGNQTLTATDTSASTVTGQTTLQVTPGNAAILDLFAPSQTTVGSPTEVYLEALDRWGNVETDYTDSVTITSTDPKAVLPVSYTFTDGDYAVYGFDVTFKSAGNRTLKVQDSADASLSGQIQFVVAPAPAKLVFKKPQAVVTAGNSFGTVVVDAVDSHGKVVSAFNGEVTLVVVNPGGKTDDGTETVYANNGVATFVGYPLTKAGVGYRLKASSFSVPVAASEPFNVTAGAATQLLVIAPPPGNVTAGRGFGLKVAVEDVYGNVATSYSGKVTLTLTSNPGGSTLGGRISVTPVNGVATFSGLTLNKVGGGYSLTTSSELLDEVTTVFNVAPGAATHLAITSQPPDSVTAGSAFELVVTALDAYGNVASFFGGNVTLTLAKNPGHSKLGGAVTLKASSGVATFTSLTLNNVGTGYKLKATSGSLTAAETDAVDVLI